MSYQLSGKQTLLFVSCGTSVLAACSSPQGRVSQAADKKPNIIYLYFDDLGYGELGCYGQSKIRTPYIDRLAEEGLRFTQHYTTFPVSAPARCGLMTGKHSGHSFIRGNYEMGGFADETEGGQMALPEGSMTIADLMKQAGYTTAGIGKWGLGIVNSSGNPQLHGFDYFYGYMDQKQSHNFYPTHLWENGQSVLLDNPFIDVHNGPIRPDATEEEFNAFVGNDYSIDRMAEKTLAFIRAHKDEPFFLYLPFTTPHLSLQCTEEAVKEYIGQFEGEQPYLGQNGYTPCRYPLSTYAAMITYTDKQVGRIMDLLRELGLDENTIFMVSSDNGATFPAGGSNTEFFHSTAGLRGRKQDLYEGGISIPFIARWPGRIPAGAVTGHVSAQYDLFATLAELTGINPDWKTDGISFLPTLLGKSGKQQQHDYLYFEFPEKSGQVAVIKGQLKGVKSDMKTGAGTWEVFDLATDRKETINIASQHPDLIREFEAIIQREHWQAQVRDWEFIAPKFK